MSENLGFGNAEALNVERVKHNNCYCNKARWQQMAARPHSRNRIFIFSPPYPRKVILKMSTMDLQRIHQRRFLSSMGLTEYSNDRNKSG